MKNKISEVIYTGFRTSNLPNLLTNEGGSFFISGEVYMLETYVVTGFEKDGNYEDYYNVIISDCYGNKYDNIIMEYVDISCNFRLVSTLTRSNIMYVDYINRKRIRDIYKRKLILEKLDNGID